jgi:hypothetical protein
LFPKYQQQKVEQGNCPATIGRENLMTRQLGGAARQVAFPAPAD